MFPFWRWNEVNFVRYGRIYKNAIQDGKLTEAVGRKALTIPIKSAKMAMSVGKVLIRTSALLAVMSAWNMLFFRDEEDACQTMLRPEHTLSLVGMPMVRLFTSPGWVLSRTLLTGLDLIMWGSI